MASAAYAEQVGKYRHRGLRIDAVDRYSPISRRRNFFTAAPLSSA
jgi:hypothetical protein